MQAEERIAETIKSLDEESVLKLYDLALALQSNKQSNTQKGLNITNIQRSQKILSSIKRTLSDDIQLEREERC